MAGVSVEAGSALAQIIQGVVQPKLMENGWVAEESDTTLSEYVTMMIVNGKDLQGVTSELGGDLLGVGEDDPAVGEFAKWLFQQLQSLKGPAQAAAEDSSMEGQEQGQEQQPQEAQGIPTQDAHMDDAAATGDGVPSGPKAMRNGSASTGRGGNKRMLGQMNNHMNRAEAQDPLRRVRGGGAGQTGRINAHANRDPPRGPRGGGVASGVQRAMAGGRGGLAGQMNPMNPMMQQQANLMNNFQPDQQMAMMQMMEMQANLMQQMMQNGQLPQQGGGPQRPGKSLFDRVNKKSQGPGLKNGKALSSPRHPNNASTSTTSPTTSGMDLNPDAPKSTPFDTICRFNSTCTNATCPFAHQSPAAPPGTPVDTTDTCSFGAACENRKCAARHPSPATRAQHLKADVDCKFFPNCTNAHCPFRHPAAPPCRNGADCAVPGCTFTHSKIMCRYTPCTKPQCPFKHGEGQRGVFKDKVWTPGEGGGEEGGEEDARKSQRFEQFVHDEANGEELILPGQNGGDGEAQGEGAQQQQQQQQTEV